MDYRIELMYENEAVMLYRTTSDLWISFDKNTREVTALTEEEAIKLVYQSAHDMNFTSKVLNGDFRRSEQEFPQLVAVMLSQIDPVEAARLLSTMPGDLQVDLIMRIAQLDAISPTDIILSVAAMEKMSPDQIGSIQQMLADIPHGFPEPEAGIVFLAPIFESLDSDIRNDIFARMNEESEALVDKIHERLFFFEDLLGFDDRAIQLVLKEVDIKELAVALKGASQKLKDLIFGNVSNRVKTMINDEIEYMGPMRLSVVKESQARIIEVVRCLEREQQIVIRRGKKGGDNDIFV
ncbi:hypothetical protein LLG96_00855 [bacterium]|nr:hypothetical protein [bacterium]